MNHPYQPLTEDQIGAMRAAAMEHGFGREQARQVVRDLDACERERQRLEREVETMRAGRQAVRETLLSDLADTRRQLQDFKDKVKDAIDTARPALTWILNHAPEPDPHALASHAQIARQRLVKLLDEE